MPVSKSSGSELYPILCLIENTGCKNNLVPVGIYHGPKKPKSFNAFLTPFVHEVKNLINNGIQLKDQICNFRIKMFLMDAVAKSSVLYVKGHSGYSSCTKCTQKGDLLITEFVFLV